MNKSFQKWCAWSAFPAMMIFFAALLIMDFLPPLAPGLAADVVADFYRQHAVEIRVGGLLMVIAGMFCAPFDAAIFLQLRRMEGEKRPIGSYAQLGSGIANILFFILPGIFFAIAAFRPDRPIDVTSALNDIAWIVTLLPWTIGAMQAFLCGMTILSHSDKSKVYPRWLGFFNVWIAIMMSTSSVVPFFQTGPFAWNGLFGFWIPATDFGIWMIVMMWMTVKAVDTETE